MAKVFNNKGKIVRDNLPTDRSKGLGDTIEKITKATGIKKIVEGAARVVNKDCGCNKRKDTLNKMFPYKK
mgnify:FL=1|jgi:hypothetical protein|tara:strand:- start:753 stop:962 length:210 start_codon:yes stop_codon:yes gene_type:complete